MAEEIADGLPTAAVIASEDGFLAGQLQHALNSGLFRAYVNPDLIGVELCAAAKNVIALAAGGVDGLAARRQREGLAHRARPRRDGAARGGGGREGRRRSPASPGSATSSSRAGAATAATVTPGELIAQGLTPERAVAEIGQTVEGLTTAPILRDLSHRLGVELPITEGVCAVLSGESLTELAAGLMGREPTEE